MSCVINIFVLVIRNSYAIIQLEKRTSIQVLYDVIWCLCLLSDWLQLGWLVGYTTIESWNNWQ